MQTSTNELYQCSEYYVRAVNIQLLTQYVLKLHYAVCPKIATHSNSKIET